VFQLPKNKDTQREKRAADDEHSSAWQRTGSRGLRGEHCSGERGITVPVLIALHLGLELKPTNGTLIARTKTPTGYDLRRDATKNR
jgi:hypothetical protein